MSAWLEDAVFYEIYPQSFNDSNADGIGDIKGIIEKLPYIADLGFNALWINPCFESPFRDAGYDVSDFYTVAPRYGTNEDLVSLFAEAKRHGIHVMLDLVAAHTSDQHPWFKASQSHEKNQYSDWYIWTPSVWNWTIPNQPLVVGCAERDGNYVPNFFAFQPALNYGYARPDPKQPWQQAVDAPGPQAVRAELKKIMAYWFDRGASGFRVDMAGSLIKLDTDGSATAALWREFRQWMDTNYPECALVAEWSEPQISLDQGFHMDFLLPYNRPGYQSLFRKVGVYDTPIFHPSGRGNVRIFLDDFEKLYEQTKGKGFIAIPSGNHDASPRIGNGRSDDDLAVVFAFLMTMPGVPFVYYGDEIGMRSPEGLKSKEGGFGRTGVRTPMQWNDEANAGFSAARAEDLYLPVDEAEGRPTVTGALARKDSALATLRDLIRLRKNYPSLQASGHYRTVVGAEGVFPIVYERRSPDEHERVLVALNPCEVERSATIRAELDRAPHLLLGTQPSWSRNFEEITLAPRSFAVLKVQDH